MPARLATSSIVVRSWPFSRINARAASSSAARVRSRLSPFGLPRGDTLRALAGFMLAIGLKIVYLFYKFNTKGEIAVKNEIEELVNDGRLAGAATLVWRDGQVANSAVYGRRDLEAELPVERDTIFRIASMTK